MRPILSDLTIPTQYQAKSVKEIPPDSVGITWLGVTGFALKYRKTTLLIDPYVTRASLLSLAFRRLRPDMEQINRYVPKSDYICVGHTHYDHVADVPAIVQRDGALVFGSRSCSNFLAKSGVKRNKFSTVPRKGGVYEAGDFHVTMIEGCHGPIFFGRVPYPGPISADIEPPLRTMQFRVGDVFGVHVKAGDVSVFHNGTANLVDEVLSRLSANLLLAGLSGAENTENYLSRLCAALGPRYVLPTHYDAFFGPISNGLQVLPIVSLANFYAQAEQLGKEIVMPSLVEQLWLTQDGQLVKSATAEDF